MRTLIFILSLSLLPLQALADQNTLARLSNVLNQNITMEAPFTQHNADSSTSTGTLYLKRPGKLRMEYDNPKDPLLIVGANSINIYDGKRDKSPEVYPLRRTPLWHLLKRHVNLTNGEGITRTFFAKGYFWMTAYDPDTPEAGIAHFYFDPTSLDLRGWVSETAEGNIHIELGRVTTGKDYSSFLFSAHHETESRNR